MKKNALYLIMTTLLFLIAFPAHADDIQEGFQGIKWGTNIESKSEFKELYTKNNVKYYSNPQKSFEINGNRLSDVIYGSYLGAFFAVYMDIDQPEIFTEVKSYLKNKYGLPKRSFSAKNEEAVESWEENNIKIKLKHNEKSWETKLAFYYTPISKNVNEEVQEEEFSKKGIRILPPEESETYDSHPLLVF